jgi:hypothetical protein
MIADPFGRVGTGKEWSDDEDNGVLFADTQDVGPVSGSVAVLNNYWATLKEIEK